MKSAGGTEYSYKSSDEIEVLWLMHVEGSSRDSTREEIEKMRVFLFDFLRVRLIHGDFDWLI